MTINIGKNREYVGPCDTCPIVLRLGQTPISPYDGHFFRQFLSSPYYCQCYFINICNSNAIISFKALIWCKLDYISRGNIHMWSPYPFVNLSARDFSVTYKTKSTCTNLEGKGICFSLWKTLLKLLSSPSSTFGGIRILGEKKKKSIDYYFSILFFFSILFPNWISLLRYFFFVCVTWRWKE